jgi:hypothetical protein
MWIILNFDHFLYSYSANLSIPRRIERFCNGTSLRNALTSASVIGSLEVSALLAATVVLNKLPNVGPSRDSDTLRE